MSRKSVRETERKRMVTIVILLMLIAITVCVFACSILSDANTKETAKIEYNNIEVDKQETNTIIVDIERKENVIENNVIENTIEEETTTKEESGEEENTSDKISNNNEKGTTKYRLEVNCEQNVVNVYTKDENGNYTNCVKAMLCSIGDDTPKSGTYSLKKYDNWEWKGLFGDVYGQYATQITGDILFHSVPYTTKYDNASLEYEEYDKLGTPASMGCIRLTVENAKWIYDNCEAGTKVEFYNDSNPGPLGKPSEQKISSEIEYRNWDPTDPNPNNPWRNYQKEEENENTITNSEKTENNTTSNTQVENKIENSATNTQVENNIEEETTNTQDENNIKENTTNTQEDNNITNTQKENKIENKNNKANNTTNKQLENNVTNSKSE